jgi:hypothetical protein
VVLLGWRRSRARRQGQSARSRLAASLPSVHDVAELLPSVHDVAEHLPSVGDLTGHLPDLRVGDVQAAIRRHRH